MAAWPRTSSGAVGSSMNLWTRKAGEVWAPATVIVNSVPWLQLSQILNIVDSLWDIPNLRKVQFRFVNTIAETIKQKTYLISIYHEDSSGRTSILSSERLGVPWDMTSWEILRIIDDRPELKILADRRQ